MRNDSSIKTLSARGRPEISVIGHVAEDHIAGTTGLGGAAAFGARVGLCLGARTALATVAPRDPRLLAPLLREPRLLLARSDADLPTTFELDYSGPTRTIYLRHRARNLQPTDIPVTFRQAPVAYVASVIGECDRAVIECLQSGTVVVGAQGWLRSVEESTGRLVPALSREVHEIPRGIAAIVYSELDHPDAEDLARHFAASGPAVALTRGAEGVSIFFRQQVVDVPAVPAREVDPTGAGDVFGIVFGLALHQGASLVEAAHVACEAAARVVEGAGLGKLPHARDAILGRLAVFETRKLAATPRVS